MSCNEMMCGFAIKTTEVKPNENIEDICNFNKSLLIPQLFHDDKHGICAVLLVNSEHCFSDSLSFSIDIDRFLNADIDLRHFSFKNHYKPKGNCVVFAKVWYNGSDSGSLFED